MSDTENNSCEGCKIDYNMEYMTHKRCFKCQRETEGIKEYQSVSKNGKVRTCKTCYKCRSSVKSSLLKHREPTIKEKYEIIKKFIMLSNQTQINEILENMEDDEKTLILKILS